MHHIRPAVLLVSTVIAWSLCVTSSQAIGWLPGPAFADDGFILSPDVAISSDGVSNVVWTEGVTSQELYLRRRAADGTLGPTLNVGSGGFPTVETTHTGSVVAWMESSSNGSELRPMVSWVSAEGVISTRAAGVASTSIAGPPALAVEPDGDAMIAWGDGENNDVAQLHVRRMVADGQNGQTIDLGKASLQMSNARVANIEFGPDGRSFLSWQKPDFPGVNGIAAMVARFGPAGQLETSANASGTATALNPQIATGTAGVLVTWHEFGGGGSARLFAAPLYSTGPLAESPQQITEGIVPFVPQTSTVIGSDGTATIAYGRELSPTSAAIYIRRFSLDGTLGPEVPLSQPVASTPYAVLPMLTPSGDGSIVAVWVRTALSNDAETKLVSRSISEDGTVSPQVTDIPGFKSVFGPPEVAGNGTGEVALTWVGMVPPVDPDDPPATRLGSVFLDVTPPVVTPVIPSKLVRGVDGKMSVTATDVSGIASVEWQFGDGSGAKGAAVAHAYARAGQYEVAVTVTDGLGNEAVVSSTIAVREPPVPAGLKLTKVLRKKGKVSISGKLNRRATGEVSLTWKQKAGRKKSALKSSAKISKGTFKATIKLKGKLAKSRAAGKLTVAYAGNEATRPAKASRTVKAPK